MKRIVSKYFTIKEHVARNIFLLESSLKNILGTAEPNTLL